MDAFGCCIQKWWITWYLFYITYLLSLAESLMINEESKKLILAVQLNAIKNLIKLLKTLSAVIMKNVEQNNYVV